MNVDLPGWTCPLLDALAETVRRHVPAGDEQLDALIRIEALRVAHVQLRVAASRANPRKAEREVARLEERIAKLQESR